MAAQPLRRLSPAPPKESPDLYSNAQPIGHYMGLLGLHYNIFDPTRFDKEAANIESYIKHHFPNQGCDDKILIFQESNQSGVISNRHQTLGRLMTLLFRRDQEGPFADYFNHFIPAESEFVCAAANFAFDRCAERLVQEHKVLPAHIFHAKLAFGVRLPASQNLGNDVEFQQGYSDVDIRTSVEKMSATIDIRNTHAIIFFVILDYASPDRVGHALPIVVYRNHGGAGTKPHLVVYGGNSALDSEEKESRGVSVDYDINKLEQCKLVAQVYEEWMHWANTGRLLPNRSRKRFDRHRDMSADFGFYEPVQSVLQHGFQCVFFTMITMFEWMNHKPSIAQLRSLSNSTVLVAEVHPRVLELDEAIMWRSFFVRILATYELSLPLDQDRFAPMIAVTRGELARKLVRRVNPFEAGQLLERFRPPGTFFGSLIHPDFFESRIFPAVFELMERDGVPFMHLDRQMNWPSEMSRRVLPDIIHAWHRSSNGWHKATYCRPAGNAFDFVWFKHQRS